jgi:P2-related tail formation protein
LNANFLNCSPLTFRVRVKLFTQNLSKLIVCLYSEVAKVAQPVNGEKVIVRTATTQQFNVAVFGSLSLAAEAQLL